MNTYFRHILDRREAPRKSLRLGLVILLALLPACNSETSKPNLPQHTVGSNTSLAPKDGRRITIHVSNTDLTKDECRTLISAYRDDAGPEGQVAVRKPDKRGDLQPWCVDNMDGQGVSFNDYFFVR